MVNASPCNNKNLNITLGQRQDNNIHPRVWEHFRVTVSQQYLTKLWIFSKEVLNMRKIFDCKIIIMVIRPINWVWGWYSNDIGVLGWYSYSVIFHSKWNLYINKNLIEFFDKCSAKLPNFQQYLTKIWIFSKLGP